MEGRLVFHVGEVGVSCLKPSGDILLHIGNCWKMLPIMCCLRYANRWKSLGPILWARLWLVMALELGGYALPSLQLWSHTQCLPSLWTMNRGASMKQVDCKFFTPVYSIAIQALVPRWGRCCSANWATSRVPWIHQILINVLGIWVCVALFS